MPVLYIGNKNYSSWSMRPWLALTWAGIAFEERVLPLGVTGYGKSKQPAILAASPSGRVPALDLGGTTIWDSLAICEWAAETAPAAGLLPKDATARALCRAAVAEMHSGFAGIRRDAPMNIKRRKRGPEWSADAQGDLARIEELWGDLRGRYGAGGPFLFGQRTIADAFYAPIATRLRSYEAVISPVSRAYCDAIFADAAFQAWETAALAEHWVLGDIDDI